MTSDLAPQMLAIAVPALLLIYLISRREWQWIGLYLALSFTLGAAVNFYALLSDLWGFSDPGRKPIDSSIIGCVLYFGGMIGAMLAPSGFRTFFVALAAMETLFVGVIPIYRFAFDLDQGAYFAINGQDIPDALGLAITLLFAILPMVVGVPWLLARQSSSEKTIIAPALSRYGVLSGIGVVSFMTVSTCFVAWGYIGRGPFSGEAQKPAFEMIQSVVTPNMIFGLLMGCIIYLFWSFPKRFFDPVVSLLEESQNITNSKLEEVAHPLWRGVARNLDESRREALESQKELNQMRSLLLSFFNTSPADMSVKTIEGKLVYCSPGLAAEFGRTQNELQGDNESEYYSAEELERHKKIDARLLSKKGPVVEEVYNPVSARHELQTYFPIFDDAGEVSHVGAMFFDIDDRVTARQQQKKAENWLGSFVKNAPAAMIIAEPETNRYLLVNSVAAEFYGMTADELLASDPSEALQYWPRWKEDMAPAVKQAMLGGEPQTIETLICRKNEGTVANYLVSLFPLIDESRGTPLLASVGLDITAIRQAERALAEREAQLSALFEHVPADIAVFDKDHRVVMVNKLTAQGLGEEASVFRGKHPAEYAQHWEDFESVFATGVNVQTTGKPERFTSRFTPPGKDRQIVYDTMFFPIKSASGEVEQVGLFLFDITKQAEAEKALVEQTNQIHQSEKLAALGQLLAGVAHELNNPLAIVKGRASILRERLAGTRHEEAIARLGEAADRCTRIVKTFLAMARQVGPQRGPVAINDLVEGALDMTASGLRKSGIVVERKFGSAIPDIESDGDQLVQAVINLLVNAQHALEDYDGERRLRISTSHDPAKNEVAIEIADSGPGISAELAERIFEPFFTTKPVGQGTGLGLSVCKGMVETNGGSLTLSETPGGGATFRIALPVVAPSIAVSAAPPKSPVRRARKLKALVVDDEPDLIEVLTDGLGTMGFECEKAGNGREGLAAIAKTRFDAVFCDVRMPEMDGLDFYRALSEKHPELVDRLAFISGDVLHNDVVRLTAEASCPVIEKPFDLDQVRATALALVSAGASE